MLKPRALYDIVQLRTSTVPAPRIEAQQQLRGDRFIGIDVGDSVSRDGSDEVNQRGELLRWVQAQRRERGTRSPPIPRPANPSSSLHDDLFLHGETILPLVSAQLIRIQLDLARRQGLLVLPAAFQEVR